MSPKNSDDAPVALVPAAGQGRRFGGDTAKQSLYIAGKSLLEWSLIALQRAGCEQAVIATSPGAAQALQAGLGDVGLAVEFCDGGPSRAASVLNLLRHLRARRGAAVWTLVHDAVRPCVEPGQIRALVDQVRRFAKARPQQPVGGALAVPVDAALRQAADGGNAEQESALLVQQCLDRRNLWLMQTPQMFRAGELLHSLEQWSGNLAEVEDESQAFAAAGGQVLLVPGSATNLKITRRDQLQVASQLLSSAASSAP